jgi:flavin reductase (DIM6/NTAB) family NADH-FMN oxidoreductase RutF
MKDMASEMTNLTAQNFAPDGDNTRLLRDAFGRFATGITVISTKTDDGVIGMTANSFSSLSLDPALVMWSPGINSSRFKYFSHAKHFAIHVLSDKQKDICEAFAKNGYAFRDIEHGLNTHGVPLIESCIARFECSHVATHPAGDHVIVIGQVNNAQVRTGRPLVFSSGNYGVIEEL